jgi:hypothetical protein
MATETKTKKGIDTKVLVADSISAGEVVVGMMGANALNQLLPIENKFIKSAIPLGVGAAGLILMQKNTHVKHISMGMVAFGAIALMRTALLGTDGVGNVGIGNVGNNETVSKIANMLLPNLGNAEQVVYRAPEMATDQPDFAEAEVVEDDMSIRGIENLRGNDGSLFPELRGAYNLYEQDEYALTA